MLPALCLLPANNFSDRSQRSSAALQCIAIGEPNLALELWIESGRTTTCYFHWLPQLYRRSRGVSPISMNYFRLFFSNLLQLPVGNAPPLCFPCFINLILSSSDESWRRLAEDHGWSGWRRRRKWWWTLEVGASPCRIVERMVGRRLLG